MEKEDSIIVEKSHCGSCGKKTDYLLYYEELDWYLCNECMDTTFGKERQRTKPKEVIRFLDRFIIGQTKAKRTLAYAVHCHFRAAEIPDMISPKLNMFIIGPTGSGKTLMAETLAKNMGVPFLSVDMTKYTQSGYVGRMVDSIFDDLLLQSEDDISKAEKAIIVFDEIDKLRQVENEIGRDINGKGVQQELLKILDGTDIPVEIPNIKRKIPINTSKMLFICSGAFVGIEECIRKRMKLDEKVVGFAKNRDESKKQDLSDEIWKHVTQEDLIAYGMMPELVGRVPSIVTLDAMTKETIFRILNEAEDSPITAHRNIFYAMGIDLVFDFKALYAIAEQAYKSPTGARAVNGILQEILQDITIEACYIKNLVSVTITEETVRYGKPPLYEIKPKIEKPISLTK